MAEHGMVGMAIIHSHHDDLRSMGITSVGHRLTILKNVYTLKLMHDIPIEEGDYIPVCKLESLVDDEGAGDDGY